MGNPAVGARVRAIRRARGLSLQEVEEKSQGKLKASVMGAYERGHRDPTSSKVEQIANFFGVTPASLMGSGAEKPARVAMDRASMLLSALDKPLLDAVRLVVVNEFLHDSPGEALTRVRTATEALIDEEEE